MQIVATVISIAKLGYYVDIVSDGELYIGAFYATGGIADFIPGTGSRDLLTTLGYVEAEMRDGMPEVAPGLVSRRSNDEINELRYECGRDAIEEV